MNKKLIINSCASCLFLAYEDATEEDQCRAINYKKIDQIYESIPDWCPLETTEENITE